MSEFTVEAPADLDEPEIRLPSPPAPPEPPHFPVVAVIAPIGIGVTLFAVMGTTTVLLLILFGPLIAIGHVVDRRIGGRRRRRRALEAYERDLVACEAEIERAHARLFARARREQPFARDLVAGAARQPGNAVVVGVTTITSGLRLSGGADAPEELRRAGSRLDGAPLTTSARRLRIDGVRLVVTGACRALIVHLTTETSRLHLAGDGAEGIIAELESAGVALSSAEHADAVLVVGTSEGTEVDATLTVDADGAGVLAEGTSRIRCRADSLGAHELRTWARGLATRQQRERAAAELLPHRCELAQLTASSAPPRALGARFALGASGPIELDLVADGPHAAIAGTTGSGKSELLIAWAVALAAARTSSEVTMLCLDFKGGATFDQLERLPHCVGVVTDLDDGEATRVMLGMRAELHRREAALRRAGVRDLAEAPELMPRLVVLVDEFQALVDSHTDLNAIITDLAARGRSLGIHLVLCTQRPSGVFRESLLANASLRIALRLEQVADSRLLLGTDDAAKLPIEPRGRVLIRRGIEPPRLGQVAVADSAMITELAAGERQRRLDAGLGEPWRPWQPPLPTTLTEYTDGWALADDPEHQRQFALSAPDPGLHLAVIGRTRSGKSTTLRAIATSAAASGRRVLRVSADPEVAVDELDHLVRHGRDAVVCIDDLDRLEQALPEEHRGRLADTVLRLVRGAPTSGCTLVATATRSTGLAAKVVTHAAQVLRFPATSRQDWLLQGGEAAHVLLDAPAGRGRVGAHLVQVVDAANDPAEVILERRWSTFTVPTGGLVIVARRAGVLGAVFEARGHPVRAVPTLQTVASITTAHPGEGAIIAGDLEQWQAAYGVLPRLAERMPVLVIGARPGEWRTLFRGDPPPPIVLDEWATGVLRYPDGRCVRVRLVDGVPTETERYEAVANERGISAPSAT